MSKLAIFLSGGWHTKYRLPYSETPPSVVLDFINQRYYDGTSETASLSSLVSNPGTINSNGMLCTAVNIAAAGKLLTTFQNTACTVLVQTTLGNNNITPAGSLIGFNNDDINAPLFQTTTQTLNGFNGGTVSGGPLVDWSKSVFSAATWDRSSRGVCLNGGAITSSNFSNDTYPIPTTVNIGSSWGILPFTGYIQKLAIWPQKVSSKELQSITWQLPFLRPRSGSRGVGFGQNLNGYATPGNILQYERTQPWTIICGMSQRVVPTAAAVMVTNVVTLNWNGYEFWIDDTGVLRVRIMGNWDGGSTGLIDVTGSTNICDGIPHIVAATYDGSSTAAGVKIYIDGYLETLVVQNDSLTASIVSGNPNYYVGNQLNLNFSMDFIDFFQEHNVVRDATYLALHSSGHLPPIDANVVVSYDFEEGTGGTTADGSSSGYTATFGGTSAFWFAP